MARNRSENSPIAPDLGEAQTKKNRPKDTRLRQQRLPAWQPILTAKTVIPIVFTISVLFVPIGIILLHISNSVQEHIITYVNTSNGNCEQRSQTSDGRRCNVSFTLEEDFQGDVYFYYGLENYFQNHRRYMKSRDDKQLLGENLEANDACKPNDKIGGNSIAPCGAIANSMFNDTFDLHFGPTQVPWSHEDLVWPIDREVKFKNPKCDGRPCQNIKDLCAEFQKWNTVKPPNWQREPCKLDEQNVENSGFQNADFIIWMRTAALPDFRKPYRKLKREAGPFVDGLPAGHYWLLVVNNYNVSSFGGKKTFVISTTSWMGGKNPFLGYAYIFVGVLCALLGVVFIFIHFKYGHTLHEIAGLEQSAGRPRSQRRTPPVQQESQT